MKFLITVLILLALFAIRSVASRSMVETRRVEKCTIPRKFEGKIKVNVKTTGPLGNTQQAFGSDTIHVDATNGRAAVFETVYSHGQMTKVNAIMTEANKKTTTYYTIPELKRCLKTQINAPLLSGTPPKNTTLPIREGLLGGVPVQIWEADVKEGEARAHVQIYLTQDKCMLVSLKMKVLLNGVSLTATETFTDMKEGVEDESVFDLPEYCLQQGYGLGGLSSRVEHHHSGNRVNTRHHDWHLQHAATRHRVHCQLGL